MTSITTVPDYGVRGRRWWPAALALLGVIASGAYTLNWYVNRQTVTAIAGSYYTVRPMDLVISIKKDGELAAVNNIDITCEVEGQSRIQSIAKEGSYVKKGDVVVQLDSAEIARKLQDAKVQLQKSESDLTTAKEEQSIQDDKNTADLEAAQVDLTLAQLDLAEYVDGKYPQTLKETTRAVEMARITLKNKQEDYDQIQRLYEKGFVTAVDKKSAELAVLQAQNDLDKENNELLVLQKYTFEKESTDRRNKVEQARHKLARTASENSSTAKQKTAAVLSAQEAYKTQKYQVEHMEKQLAACTIKAPSDGLVVYGTSGQSWYSRDRPIQEGAQVNQQELLIRLPDTSKMKAVVKVPESWIGMLKTDEKHPIDASVEIVGVPHPVTAKVTSVSVMADSSQRWWNPDARDYPVELTLDQTPPGLKPGASAKADIQVQRLPHVLTVPVNAIFAAGQDRYVFVKDLLHGLHPQKVTLGQNNDTHVQVTAGLTADQDVLLLQVGQGRELLEKAGIKMAETTSPTTKPAGGAPAGEKPTGVAAAR